MHQRTHYQVLGVQPDAEDLVIKAAYRALAQRYHPDKWDGDKAIAQQRMVEINAAYAVLSDDVKRREYDAELKSTGSDQQFAEDTNQDDEFADYFSEKEDDWKFAVSYFPQIETDYQTLKTISLGLAVEFKILIIETKRFKESQTICLKMRQDFLKRHFGSDTKVLALVDELLKQRKRKALLEVNRAVRVLGASLDVEKLAVNISENWNLDHELIDCIINNRVIPNDGEKFTKLVKTSMTSMLPYLCGNCRFVGPFYIQGVSKGFLGWEQMLHCPKCGNKGRLGN